MSEKCLFCDQNATHEVEYTKGSATGESGYDVVCFAHAGPAAMPLERDSDPKRDELERRVVETSLAWYNCADIFDAKGELEACKRAYGKAVTDLNDFIAAGIRPKAIKK